MNALLGMRNLISLYQPILAISVYHDVKDLYCIPQYIAKIRKDYRIYFRHYSQGLIESVMFFVPNTNHIMKG
ncbi:hypothetical protein [Helicobacter aurati]|nr:hypothetical protein [Helicobacter aurati]